MATTGYRKKRAFPRVQRRTGAPVFWAYMEGPRRTFASDAGDVADLTRRRAAGVRGASALWVDGPRGKRLSFLTNTSAAVARFSDAGLPAGGKPSSISCRVQFASLTNTTQIFLSYGIGAAAEGLFVYLAPPNVFAVSAYGTTLNSSVSAVAGREYHYCVTHDGDNWRGYLDGALILTGSQATNPILGGGLCLGYPVGTGVSGAALCYLDDVRIYDYRQSDAQVARDAADPEYWTRPRRRVATFALSPAPASRAAALLMMGP